MIERFGHLWILHLELDGTMHVLAFVHGRGDCSIFGRDWRSLGVSTAEAWSGCI